MIVGNIVIYLFIRNLALTYTFEKFLVIGKTEDTNLRGELRVVG